MRRAHRRPGPTPPPPRRAGAPGFTMMELLVAVGVISLVLLGIVGVFLVSYTNVDHGGRVSRATTYAHQKMEELRNTSFGLLASGEDVCLATNGDVVTNVRLKPLVQAHRQLGCLATVVLAPFISPYGIVEVDPEDHIIAFHEKPELPYWMNAGIYVLSRELERTLPEQGDHEDSTFPQLALERRLGAYKSRAYWRSVDTVKDISEVAKELEKRLMTGFLA